MNQKGDFAATDLLSRERAIRHAFETFEPSWSWRIDSANTRYDQYEVREECLNNGFVLMILYKICDGLWGRSTRRVRLEPFRAMGIVELVPPNWRGERWQQHWSDLGMDVTDFSLDVASDLLVLMEYRDDE